MTTCWQQFGAGVNSIHDQIGTYDMTTTDEVYFERGVSRRHGYLTEYHVEEPEYIVNGKREYFEAALRDLAMAEAQYPGWVAQLLTHPVRGLDNYQQLIETLTSGTNVIKAFCEVAPLDAAVSSAAVNGLAAAHNAQLTASA